MLAVWDEPKRATNLTNHGLDFADAERRFVFEDSVIRASYSGLDGRPRFIAIGPLDGRLVTAVFSPLGTEALSLISQRPASRKERRLYEQS